MRTSMEGRQPLSLLLVGAQSKQGRKDILKANPYIYRHKILQFLYKHLLNCGKGEIQEF